MIRLFLLILFVTKTSSYASTDLRLNFYGDTKELVSKRFIDELEELKGLYRQCEINVISNIRILDKLNTSEFIHGKEYLYYLRPNIDIFSQVNFDYNRNSIHIFLTKGSVGGDATDGWAKTYFTENLGKEFPQYFIFVGSQRYKDAQFSLLAHELGHILFQEGHNTRKGNIMYSKTFKQKLSIGFSAIKKRKNNITEKQCRKAKEFISKALIKNIYINHQS